MKLFTVGHSSHSLDSFVRLFQDNGIMTLVDVRTAPYSRHNLQFNRENLEGALSQRNIRYRYAGTYLGGHPTPHATRNGYGLAKARITCMR